MISFGSCIYPTLGSVKVSPSRVASPENYKHQTLKVSGVTPRPELPPITLRELTQQATNLHVRPPFCDLRYTDVHKRVTDT